MWTRAGATVAPSMSLENPALRFAPGLRGQAPQTSACGSGQLVSLVGTWMQSVAQGWLMHRLTASAFMLGLLSFAQFVPVLPLALWAGVLADRGRQAQAAARHAVAAARAGGDDRDRGDDRRREAVDGARARVLLRLREHVRPARAAVVRDRDHGARGPLERHRALNSAAFNVARILGPRRAGLLLAGVRQRGCFWLNAASFAAVLFALSALRLPKHAPAADTRSLGSTLRDGVRYAWGRRPSASCSYCSRSARASGSSTAMLLRSTRATSCTRAAQATARSCRRSARVRSSRRCADAEARPLGAAPAPARRARARRAGPAAVRVVALAARDARRRRALAGSGSSSTCRAPTCSSR